jgi:hypothetical protein
MCVLIFSTTSACNISHSKNYSVRYYHKYMLVFILTLSLLTSYIYHVPHR